MANQLQPIERFVIAHSLHSCMPVALSVLSELWAVRYVPLDDGLQGMAVWSSDVGAIAVNSALDDYEQRAVLCHEAAHIILDHPNTLYLCRLNGWFHSRYERQAQQAAALLLIPRGPLLEMLAMGATADSLAEAFGVPVSLVDLRLKMGATRL